MRESLVYKISDFSVAQFIVGEEEDAEGNIISTAFSSSDTDVAEIDEISGIMKTKKAGKTTISCIGEDGKTYKYKVTVEERGLSYNKLTTYYYTDLAKGMYTAIPLVAKGIDVKNWKSSNKKVCKVENCGIVGYLKMTGTGKCTITCTDKNNKTYKCKLTVVSGKAWGLTGDYRPTLSTVKKHGYYKDINKIMDYGKAVVCISENLSEIKINNGNGSNPIKKSMGEDNIYWILKNRYPEAEVYLLSEDYLYFTNDKKTKEGRLRVICYYVD